MYIHSQETIQQIQSYEIAFEKNISASISIDVGGDRADFKTHG